MSRIEPRTGISIAKVSALKCMSSSGADFSIEEIAKSAGITGLEYDAPSNPVIGEAPILDNGLNLLYAPSGHGKSYTSIAIAGESGLPAVFIDLESNGKMFVNHCKKNGVSYVYAGGLKDVIEDVRKLVLALKKNLGKVFIIIDSYSDMFPEDDGQMAKYAQKQLGDMHKFFMREAELPVLILDHATEQKNPQGVSTGFKLEGNKSGKHKKAVCVLRLEQIGSNIDNGTFITVEKTRNQDELPLGYIKQYRRNAYLKDKLQMLIDEGKLPEEFTATDLKSCTRGDDRELWQKDREEIADIVKKDGKKEYWKLK